MSGLAVSRIKRPTGSGIGRRHVSTSRQNSAFGRSGLVIDAPVKLENTRGLRNPEQELDFADVGDEAGAATLWVNDARGHLPHGLTYCAAARIGTCALRKRRTRSIVRCLRSSGSFTGTP